MFNIIPYMSIQWEPGKFCCGDYVALVLKDHIGVDLPPLRFEGGIKSAAMLLRNTPLRKLFVSIPDPKPYCVVEMQMFKSPDHVGVCVELNGKLFITHCERGSGAVISTFEEIRDHYKIVGFYEYCVNKS